MVWHNDSSEYSNHKRPFAQYYEPDGHLLRRIVLCICASFVFLMGIGMFPRIFRRPFSKEILRVEVRSSLFVWVDNQPFTQLKQGVLSDDDVKRLTSLLALNRRARKSSQVSSDSNDVVLLEAEKELKFKTVEQIVRASRNAGFSRFNFAVD